MLEKGRVVQSRPEWLCVTSPGAAELERGARILFSSHQHPLKLAPSLPSPSFALFSGSSRMATNNYTQNPPSYRPNSPYKDPEEEATSPLLGSARAGPSTGGGAVWDMPSEGELPDDFKVCLFIYFLLHSVHVSTHDYSSMACPFPSQLRRSDKRSSARFILFCVCNTSLAQQKYL
jgi:hypothetical protein